MDEHKNQLIGNILHLLYTAEINYFSFTIFKKHKPILTYCNNKNWFNYCLNKYGTMIPEPIQMQICSSKLNIIDWSILTIDKQVTSYINKRNSLAKTKISISLLYRLKDKFIIVTFGANKDKKYLINFIYGQINFLYLLTKRLAR